MRIKPSLISKDAKILAPSFRKYWYLIVVTIAASLLAAIFEGFSVGLLIPFLESLSEPDNSGFRTGWVWFDQHLLGVGASQLSRMYRICSLILIASWFRSGLTYLSTYYGIKSRVRISEDLRMRLIDRLQEVSLRFFSTTRSGELINSFTNELERISHAFGVLATVITRGTLLLVYCTLMIWISWELSLLALFFFGLLSLGLTRLIAVIRGHGRQVTEAAGHLTSAMTEFINGVRTVVAFNMQPFERERLHQATLGLADCRIQTEKRRGFVQPLSQAVVSTVLVAIVVLSVQLLVIPGKLEIALLLTFLFALLRLMPIVHQLNGQRGQWAVFQGAMENVAELLKRKNKPYLKDGPHEAPPLQNALVFDNVSFSYQPGQPVLKAISLRIPHGKTTAFVGASGAGKSTLADLIPRFYDPTKGHIYWDGIDLRNFKRHSLREKIAIVSQDTFIFNDTVRANIAYGKPDASLKEIRAAARKANALEFIQNMSEGFESVLGDRGVRVSGGQRQRLAIARALLRDPEILILDEATSDLDSISEKKVQQSLEVLMEGRTVIAIAHRLSTIENANWVVVLEEGEIEEQGPYTDLINQKGKLWEYHSIQFQTT